LLAGHAKNVLGESFDGGESWKVVTTASGMAEPGGTAEIFFIDNGDATATRDTWLWQGVQNGGMTGTWRTTDAGTTWKQVDNNEHVTGVSQIYQPDTKGVVFMAGLNSKLGAGVLRSTDYGITWAHVGLSGQEGIVFGTTRSIYALYGWGQKDPVALEVGEQPGTGTWTAPATPMALSYGPAMAAVTNDGTYDIIVTANFSGGLWRYIEPTK
jgi:hypothetical protein